MADLLGNLRTYLIAQGVCRKPSVAGASPPMWLEPQQGVPAPGEQYPGGDPTGIGATVVLGAFRTGGFATGPYESAWRIPTVDIRIRASRADYVTATEVAITPLLIDKREWMMGALNVIESQMWRALQPITIDAQSFDYVVSYSFQLYAP
jgi:hypothetical protein